MSESPSSRRSWARLLPSWRSAGSSTEPPFDPTSWTGALIVMLGAAGVLWIVQIVNVAQHYRLNRFALRPRRIDGLWGVLTEPFLHDSWGHLAYNTVSFVLVGWVVLLAGLRNWLQVTGMVIVVGGLLTWLVAPAGLIHGAGPVVFGWFGYLLARAYFSRKVRWIVVAGLVLFFFGGLLVGALPSLRTDVVWQAHLCGFVAGVIAGAVLHPRRARRRAVRMPGRPPAVS